MKSAVFHVGPVPVEGDLILAPMDGITSHPFRLLARQLGSAASYTEFLGAMDVIHGKPHLEDHLYFSEAERPLAYQIIDNDPQKILAATLRLQERRPDWIDINMGCPAKDVSGRGAGAGLLLEMDKVKALFTLLVKNLAIPVTAKIRLGWDDEHLTHLETAALLQDCGVAAIAVHGRTRSQGYTGAANWDAIAEVKAHLSIPVIANGDVRSVADIERIQHHTGCDAVMIGRATLANPWLFSRRDRDAVGLVETFDLIRHHLELMLDFYGLPHGLVFFRKHLVQYLTPYAVTRELRRGLLTCEDVPAFLNLLAELQASLTRSPAPGSFNVIALPT